MKKLVLVLSAAVVLFSSCEEGEFFDAQCDCNYVTYDLENGEWVEDYRSTWDSSCDNELLSESSGTYSDGEKWYSKTLIECK